MDKKQEKLFIDRGAPLCDDQLPLISQVGRGLKGDSFKIEVDEPSDSETYLTGWTKDSATGEWTSKWTSENINGGQLMYMYKLRPFTSPQTFTITFKLKRPGKSEWAWTTPAIPYVWDADGDGEPDVDDVVGSGVATVYVKPNLDGAEWADKLVYPDGTTGEDFNTPDPGNPWTVNLTYGLGGDIDVPTAGQVTNIIEQKIETGIAIQSNDSNLLSITHNGSSWSFTPKFPKVTGYGISANLSADKSKLNIANVSDWPVINGYLSNIIDNLAFYNGFNTANTGNIGGYYQDIKNSNGDKIGVRILFRDSSFRFFKSGNLVDLRNSTDFQFSYDTQASVANADSWLFSFKLKNEYANMNFVSYFRPKQWIVSSDNKCIEIGSPDNRWAPSSSTTASEAYIRDKTFDCDYKMTLTQSAGILVYANRLLDNNLHTQYSDDSAGWPDHVYLKNGDIKFNFELLLLNPAYLDIPEEDIIDEVTSEEEGE